VANAPQDAARHRRARALIWVAWAAFAIAAIATTYAGVLALNGSGSWTMFGLEAIGTLILACILGTITRRIRKAS
jgi:hypothetical protein